MTTANPAPLSVENLQQVLQFYATKEDLANMETRLVRAISELRAETLRAYADSKADMLKTLILVMLGGIAATATLTAGILTAAIQIFG